MNNLKRYGVAVLKITCALFLTFIASSSTGQTFTLNAPATTSAGVYKSDRTLVRVLWSGLQKPAGVFSVLWDGKDDDGNQLPPADYHFEIVENNVHYTWKGVIGNNSDSLTGSTVHRSMYGISDMARAGNNVYCALGYNEQFPALYKFNTNTPQQKQWILDNPTGNGTAEYISNVCTDGQRVYWGAADPISGRDFFVFATNVSDDKFYKFTGRDTSYDLQWGRVYPSVIGYRHTDNSNGFVNINGIAVQTNGNFLFVSYSLDNMVRVYNKLTGKLITAKSFNAPTRLAVQNDGYLWIAYDNGIEKDIINDDGSLTKIGQIRGVTAASLTLTPDNTRLVVSDMSPASQQIKFFNSSTGNLELAFGQAGGYSKDATVSDDKFHMYSISEKFYPSIVYLDNGDFWFADQGNRRVLRFNSNLQKKDQIMFQTTTYDIAVDPNNPTRVFCGYREFKVDYSKIEAGDVQKSWTLVKNWGYNIPAGFPTTNWGLRNVVTLSNGRTYCIMHKEGNPQRNWIAELVEGGILRMTKVSLNDWGNEWIKEDGSYYLSNISGANYLHKKATLASFDGDNDPVYNDLQVIAQVPYNYADPSDNRRTGQITSTGLIISNREYHTAGTKTHVGAIALGDTTYKWKTAKELPPDYSGGMPLGDRFDQRNSIQNTNGTAMVLGRNVFWNYPAELYMGDQANVYNHLWDNGLVVGQFGVTNVSSEAHAGSAGNSRTPVLIEANGRTYIWANDEWDHAGVHLWEVTGLNTIKEQFVSLDKTVMAIGFISVNATCKNNQAEIVWTVSDEQKIKSFEVQGSLDGTKWTLIANTNKKNVLVQKPYNLYRIAAVDYEGKKTYSRVIKNTCGTTSEISIYPNPVQSQAMVTITCEVKVAATFMLLDSKGAITKSYNTNLDPGVNEVTLDVSNVAAGTYLLRSLWGNNSDIARLVKL